MARRIEIIEAKSAKAFKNEVNKFFAREDIRIAKTTYRTEGKAYSAIIEYERGLR